MPDHTGEQTLKQMLRVNHAGEFGAKCIYAGQLKALGHTPEAAVITEMAAQEQEHLEYFTQQIVERGVRPTLLQPIWYVGGHLLGYVTGMMGAKAAHACTIAVEEVIDTHYEAQLQTLRNTGGDPGLIESIERFQADEVHHRDIAINRGGKEAPGYEALTACVKAISRGAIWLSTRF